MTKYIKKAKINAEQFDGSDDMISKYHVRCDTEYMLSDDPLEYQTAPYQIETLEGWLNINAGDWIATGAMGEHWPIPDEIFKQTYRKLPVIPVEIAKAIEEYRHEYGISKGLSLLLSDVRSPWKYGVLKTVNVMPSGFRAESISKSMLVARAWIDGYEVEDKS